MRRFSAEYLSYARAGLWDNDRTALEGLAISSHDRILEAGAGSGEFTAVLAEEAAPGTTIYATDVDRGLLSNAPPPRVQADATRLPVRANGVDLVACQALLVNLPRPSTAVAEFRRVAADRVAAIEPDNSAVSISSTVDLEPVLARRLRRAFRAGTETDLALGEATGLFEAAGLVDIQHTVVHHHRVTEPPYSENALEAARRKARGTRIDATAATLRAGGLDGGDLTAIAEDWRAMGETVVEQMADRRYRRAEVVPYHVTVGRVPD